MNIVLAIFGAVFAIIAIVVFWYWRKTGKELELMAATVTSKAADAAKLTPGTVVELKGPLRCDALLVGEFSQQKCIYYHAVIEREYEQRTRNSKGDMQTNRRRDTMQSNERFAPCTLEDDSGRIAINFDRAEVEGIESVKRFEPAAIGVVGVVTSILGADRDIGMHYTETMMPADIPVYVLGTVLAGGSVGASPGKKSPFVISHKSEEERTKDLTSRRMWLMVGGIVCVAATIGFLVFAVKVGGDQPAPQKKGAIEMIAPVRLIA